MGTDLLTKEESQALKSEVQKRIHQELQVLIQTRADSKGFATARAIIQRVLRDFLREGAHVVIGEIELAAVYMTDRELRHEYRALTDRAEAFLRGEAVGYV